MSSVGTIVHNIARILVPILGPLAGKTEHHVKDSRQFSREVRELSLEPGEVMTSYDVKSLFTYIPPQGALEAVRSRLREDDSLGERTKLSVQNVCDLLELCLTSVYFVFKGVFYTQKHGGAIGSPISPVVSDIMWRISRGRLWCLSRVYLPGFGGAMWMIPLLSSRN